MAWMYCTVCRRAFQTAPGRSYCNYLDCHGSLGKIYAWQCIRELNPHYPEIPEYGVKYPFYS